MAAATGDVLTLAGPWSAPAGTASRGGSVDRLRTTDRAAAEELFNACYPRLAGWVRRLVDDDDTAHEIASEAFTRLLARWSGAGQPAELPVHDRHEPGPGPLAQDRPGAPRAAAP